jgi:hypothetical protein
MNTPTSPEPRDGFEDYVPGDSEDNDPIVAEVRRNREALFASFGYDMDRMYEQILKDQQKRGDRLVSFDPNDSD